MKPLLLAIDTTHECGSLALARGHEILEELALQAPDGFAHVIYAHLSSLLDRHHIRPCDIDCFASASGPGSFTGVRVGLACIKGLAEACNKPAVAVSNLQALATFGSAPLRAALLDARRGDIYGGVYDSEGVAVSPEIVAKLPAWLETLPPSVEFVSQDFQPELTGTRFEGAPMVKAPHALAAAIARIAYARLLRGEALDPAALDANYVRRSDAELFWERVTMPLRHRLERYFEFKALGADWRTEILAGLTTFMTMAYIVFVNPSILQETGMPVAATTAATCLSAAAGSLLMGGYARYPIALAPGMGLNAYFTYVVVKGMGIPWQAALGAVFLSGVAFLILTLTGARQLILAAIPQQLYAAVAAGVGLFIALIGFRNSGIIVPSPSTTVTLGNVRQPATALAIFGLLLIAALLAWRVRAAMLIGILVTTVLGLATGVAQWTPHAYRLSDLAATAGKLDVRATLRLGFVEIIFVFLFIDLFDNIGTLVAVGKRAGLFDNARRIPRVDRILLSDAIATIVGSLTGTSTVTSYVESAAGVAAGGRTGVTAVVTGLLFIAALFIAPVIGVIPNAATAPALIIVGSLMMAVVTEIDWHDPEVAIPAFLTMLTIPLSFSIANGLAFGFIAFTLLKILRGKFREVNWLVYLLTALFLARFLYLAQA